MSFFNELKRRNVFRVTAAYVVVGWLLLQIGDVVFEALEVDASANRMLMAFVLLGLIPTIIFSWAFEMTPEGIKRDKDVIRDEQQDRNTAKKLDYVTMTVLVLVGGMSLWQHWRSEPVDNSADLVAPPEVLLVQKTQLEIDEKSLAVLPFTNVANTADNEPFTVGIHDDLITSLSKISALKVISRTSVLNYQSADITIKEVARQLGVAHVVEGGVQRVGDQVRLNVKLVEAETEKPLWAETYNRELTASNIFKIQTEVSQEIANALQAQLTDADVQSLGKQQTDNLDAYNAYLAGRQRLLTRNTQSLYQALSLFEKATELDPEYALAYVGQADTWSLLNSYSDVSETDMLAKGEPLLEKALSLDPRSVEAHTTQANYLAEKDEIVAAKAAFEYALELSPNYPTTYHWYGNLLSRMGEKEQALEMYQKATELDPISPVIQTNIAAILSDSRKYKEALAQYDRIIELVPDFPGSASGKAGVYSDMGKLDEAIKWQRIAIKKDPGNVYRKTELAVMYLDIGLVDLAQQTIDEISIQSPSFEGIVYASSTLEMYQGNYQQAADIFEIAWQQNPTNFDYLGNLAFHQMLLGQYDQSIEGYLKLFPGKDGKIYEVRADNFDSTVNLIWSLQQTGESEQANSILNELKQMIAEFPEPNDGFRLAMVAALEGRVDDSAELFFNEYKNGASRGFWRGQHLPMLAEVIQSTTSQEFIKLYDFELNQQRNRVLAFIDLKG